MMKYVFSIWILFTFSACELGKELDIQHSDKSAGYFLECYFRPGDLYNLTATRLAPVSEPQLLDYSLEFQIHVIGDSRIKLYQSLFTHPDKDFMYNYGSQVVVERPEDFILGLEAITPTGEVITGETIVPEQVVVDTAWLENGMLYYSFDLIGDKVQDYYIETINFKRKDGSLLDRYLNYYNLNDQHSKITIQHNVEKLVMDSIVDIAIELKRVLKENYNYQLTLREIINSNTDNLTAPVMLEGNLTNALGIFTCYTEFVYVLEVK